MLDHSHRFYKTKQVTVQEAAEKHLIHGLGIPNVIINEKMYSHCKASLRQLGRRLKLYDDDREVMEKNKEADLIIDRFVEIREMMGNRKNERNQEKISGIITIKIQ